MIYKLIKEGMNSQELYEYLIDTEYAIPEVYQPQPIIFPVRPVRPPITATRAEKLQYALDMAEYDADFKLASQMQRAENQLMYDDVQLFADRLENDFKIAYLSGNDWIVTDTGYTYLQASQRVLDVYRKDDIDPLLEIAFGTSNGMMFNA